MKIQWTKSSDRMVVGTVGDVECFHLIKEGNPPEFGHREFDRKFLAPIQAEAADRIEAIETEVAGLRQTLSSLLEDKRTIDLDELDSYDRARVMVELPA